MVTWMAPPVWSWMEFRVFQRKGPRPRSPWGRSRECSGRSPEWLHTHIPAPSSKGSPMEVPDGSGLGLPFMNPLMKVLVCVLDSEGKSNLVTCHPHLRSVGELTICLRRCLCELSISCHQQTGIRVVLVGGVNSPEQSEFSAFHAPSI